VTGDTAPVQAETRYAMSGDVSIAYQVVGEGGPIDIVFAHGFVANLEVAAENPRYEAFFQRLAELGRVIRFDRRGMGLSDRVREVPTLETRMDVRTVMDAAGSPRAVLFATFEAASVTMLYAATYPERVAGLALYCPIAKGVRSPDYPWAVLSEEEEARWIEQLPARWGSRELAAEFLRTSAPTIADDPKMQDWLAGVMRLGASPGAAALTSRMAMTVDIRDVLPSIRVPTLVLNRDFTRGEATYISERIPYARRVEIGGPDSGWLRASP
jgi:pimeloyl-ACP methyl ester carboxylesterase